MSESSAPFGQVALAIRWGTTAISVALASPEIADGDGTLFGCVVVLIVNAAYRTWRPVDQERSLAGLVSLLAEVAFTTVGIAVTGYWESPLVFSMLTAVALAGFSRGFGFAVGVASVSVLSVSLAWGLHDDPPDDRLRASAEWGGEVLLVALVAGFARRISGEADERRVQALDRLGRLNDANVLLFQLHQVTQTLPASLDLDEVLDTTLEQVRDLFDAASFALLLHDEADGHWHTVRRLGGPPATSYPPHRLPPPLARAERLRSALREDDLDLGGGPGLDETARAGLYGVLEARGTTIGLIALEHGAVGHFTERDLELIGGFVDPVALAVDNARWFERLRTVGAAEERTRIARELHDRIGQSLAYVAFELDRLTKKASTGSDLSAPLDALRGDVRGVIGELRDTLYDLRTEVTEAEGLAMVLPRFLARVEARSGLSVEFRAEETARLPILQEREVWRIAQEVVAQVERQGRTALLQVSWHSDGHRGSLVIGDPADEGTGTWLNPSDLAPLRERAAAIGATVSLEHGPGSGTRVTCSLTGR